MSVRHFGTGKLTCRYVLEQIMLGPYDSMGCILLRPRGLEDMLDRLNLTHARREQVEQIMAGEALQLQMPRES